MDIKGILRCVVLPLVMIVSDYTQHTDALKAQRRLVVDFEYAVVQEDPISGTCDFKAEIQTKIENGLGDSVATYSVYRLTSVLGIDTINMTYEQVQNVHIFGLKVNLTITFAVINIADYDALGLTYDSVLSTLQSFAYSNFNAQNLPISRLMTSCGTININNGTQTRQLYCPDDMELSGEDCVSTTPAATTVSAAPATTTVSAIPAAPQAAPTTPATTTVSATPAPTSAPTTPATQAATTVKPKAPFPLPIVIAVPAAVVVVVLIIVVIICVVKRQRSTSKDDKVNSKMDNRTDEEKTHNLSDFNAHTSSEKGSDYNDEDSLTKTSSFGVVHESKHENSTNSRNAKENIEMASANVANNIEMHETGANAVDMLPEDLLYDRADTREQTQQSKPINNVQAASNESEDMAMSDMYSTVDKPKVAPKIAQKKPTPATDPTDMYAVVNKGPAYGVQHDDKQGDDDMCSEVDKPKVAPKIAQKKPTPATDPTDVYAVVNKGPANGVQNDDKQGDDAEDMYSGVRKASRPLSDGEHIIVDNDLYGTS